MELNYNVKGTERKEMVMVISRAVGMEPVYKGAPTFEYAVSNFTISKNGALSFDERVLEDEVNKVRQALKEAGFESDEPFEEARPEGEAESQTGLTIEMPRDLFTEEAITNLKRIVEGKGNLMKKAFDTQELPIIEEADKIAFPWFKISGDGDAKAYNHFIEAICNMAKSQIRITAKEKEVDNEKYAFRCFLLRLGFIGKEYKADRKILLRNLEGSSAFKNGREAQA